MPLKLPLYVNALNPRTTKSGQAFDGLGRAHTAGHQSVALFASKVDADAFAARFLPGATVIACHDEASLLEVMRGAKELKFSHAGLIDGEDVEVYELEELLKMLRNITGSWK